ncbi:MAG: ParA family protein [Myxococcota bacterium]
MHVITFATIKGGVGKTASATHVAFALADAGSRVLFVDMDPQGNGSRLLGVDATPATALAGDLLKKSPARLSDVVVHQYERLWVAPAHVRMGREEPELYQWPYAVFGLEKALMHDGAGRFDVVVVDTGPHLSCYTRSGLHAANLVMVPIPAHAGAYDGSLYVADEVRAVAEAKGAPIDVCGFISSIDLRNRVQNRAWEKLSGHVPFPVAKTKITLRNAVNKAGLEYQLIFETGEHNSEAANDYRALAAEVQGLVRGNTARPVEVKEVAHG